MNTRLRWPLGIRHCLVQVAAALTARTGRDSTVSGLATIWLTTLALAGCGDGSKAGADGAVGSAIAPAPRAEAPPAGDGQIWAIDPAAGGDPASSAATLTAFAWGLQTIVVDDRNVYIGTQKVTARPGPNGARSLKLSGTLEATLTPVGEEMELAFSNGQRVAMQPRKAPYVRAK